MKILLVGCRGMLGTDLMEALRPRHEVVGFDLPELDITSLNQCLARAAEHRPDVIINAAAFTRVDDCETHREEAMRVNAEGAGNLAQAAESSGSLLVHYSTDYVFDGLKQAEYFEDDPTGPRSVYGESKLAGEILVRRHCRNHLILRTSWLFGKNGPNFIRTIVTAARNSAPLRVVNDQRGSPTYSRDLAQQTAGMIEARCRSTYHVTNSGACTWFELACRAIEWAGMRDIMITPVATSEFVRPAPRPANSVLSNAKLAREGLPLMRPWQEAAREYVQTELAAAHP